MNKTKMRGISVIEQKEKRTFCYFVRLMRGGVTHTASFAFRKHGGKKKALEAAQKHYRKLVKTVGVAAVLMTTLSVQASRDIALGWDPNPESNVVAYKVYTGVPTNSISFVTIPATNIVTINGARTVVHTMTNLLDDVTYQFAVSAVNSAGFEGPVSDAVSVPPQPRKPSGVRVLTIDNATAVIVRWQDQPTK
jgi:hypothetical protein